MLIKIHKNDSKGMKNSINAQEQRESGTRGITAIGRGQQHYGIW